jgi:hypothetical protein
MARYGTYAYGVGSYGITRKSGYANQTITFTTNFAVGKVLLVHSQEQVSIGDNVNPVVLQDVYGQFSVNFTHDLRLKYINARISAGIVFEAGVRTQILKELAAANQMTFDTIAQYPVLVKLYGAQIDSTFSTEFHARLLWEREKDNFFEEWVSTPLTGALWTRQSNDNPEQWTNA